ncbi:MAG: hypothetical protein IJP96_04425 [Synergistaceae bacterium]|nr:hypothetical protein [Synergistaceae bacterium]
MNEKNFCKNCEFYQKLSVSHEHRNFSSPETFQVSDYKINICLNTSFYLKTSYKKFISLKATSRLPHLPTESWDSIRDRRGGYIISAFSRNIIKNSLINLTPPQMFITKNIK